MQSVFGLFIVIWLLGFILMIWALVDVIKVPDDSQFRAGSKLIWVLVVVFTGFIGALIYLVIGRPPARPTDRFPYDGSGGGGPPLPPPPARPD